MQGLCGAWRSFDRISHPLTLSTRLLHTRPSPSSTATPKVSAASMSGPGRGGGGRGGGKVSNLDGEAPESTGACSRSTNNAYGGQHADRFARRSNCLPHFSVLFWLLQTSPTIFAREEGRRHPGGERGEELPPSPPPPLACLPQSAAASASALAAHPAAIVAAVMVDSLSGVIDMRSTRSETRTLHTRLPLPAASCHWLPALDGCLPWTAAAVIVTAAAAAPGPPHFRAPA